MLVVEYSSATHPYTYIFPSVELRERFCSIVRHSRGDAPAPTPRIRIGSWNLNWAGEASWDKVGVDKSALLDWILAGDGAEGSRCIDEHDVYVMCLQGRFQEKPVGDESTDISSPDGEVAAQLLVLLGSQFTVAAKVVGVSSTPHLFPSIDAASVYSKHLASIGTIIVACNRRLMPHVTNIEIFEGSGGTQDASWGSGGFVTSKDACAVSLCISEASFLFLNWPAVVLPASGGAGLSLSQIDAMVNSCPQPKPVAFCNTFSLLFHDR
jgi:hypothetical protein